ncbi:hypothetical protein RHMOL_Rhmol06G0043200 [Rhododendron molle]|uniref:Uncharacterized protein n=1 Tax=Rhododendron molle TaxID=49168 RepID=A0ACC0N9Y7_RHOML|nr:hypothetical protein RHMOL_Rhmol06G0043200 [Rhododendron molle]
MEYSSNTCKEMGSPLPRHGMGALPEVELDSAAGEVIAAIEGFYGPAKDSDGFEVITSITLYTDRRKYGPFGGNEIGTHFSLTLSGGKAVGFFGRSGT